MLLPFGTDVSFVVSVAASATRSPSGSDGVGGSSSSDSPRWARVSACSHTRRRASSRLGVGESSVIRGPSSSASSRNVRSPAVARARPSTTRFQGSGRDRGTPVRSSTRSSPSCTLRVAGSSGAGSWGSALNQTSPPRCPRAQATEACHRCGRSRCATRRQRRARSPGGSASRRASNAPATSGGPPSTTIRQGLPSRAHSTQMASPYAAGRTSIVIAAAMAVSFARVVEMGEDARIG